MNAGYRPTFLQEALTRLRESDRLNRPFKVVMDGEALSDDKLQEQYKGEPIQVIPICPYCQRVNLPRLPNTVTLELLESDALQIADSLEARSETLRMGYESGVYAYWNDDDDEKLARWLGNLARNIRDQVAWQRAAKPLNK